MRWRRLAARYLGCLEPLGSLGDLELNFLALLERAKAVAVDGSVVDKYLLPVFHGDEAVAFLGTKPFDFAVRHLPRDLHTVTVRIRRCRTSPFAVPPRI